MHGNVGNYNYCAETPHPAFFYHPLPFPSLHSTLVLSAAAPGRPGLGKSQSDYNDVHISVLYLPKSLI